MDPLLSTALVLFATLLGLGWVTRRLRGPTSPRRSVVLTAHHALHVVELDGERLLIGTGPSGAPRLLARLPEASEQPSHASSPRAAAWPLALAEAGPAALVARWLTRSPSLGGDARG